MSILEDLDKTVIMLVRYNTTKCICIHDHCMYDILYTIGMQGAQPTQTTYAETAMIHKAKEISSALTNLEYAEVAHSTKSAK